MHRVQLSSLPIWIRPVLQGALWPEHWARSRDDTVSQTKNIEMRASHSIHDNCDAIVDGVASVAKEPREVSTPIGLLNVKNIIAKNAHALALSLSFGLCCPYLALAIGLSVYVNVLQLRYITGSFLQTRILDSSIGQLISEDAHVEASLTQTKNVPIPVIINDIAVTDLNTAVTYTNELLQFILWPLVWSSSLFIATVCFDMATDEVGWRTSLWIPLTTVSAPIFIWIGVRFYFMTSLSLSVGVSKSENKDVGTCQAGVDVEFPPREICNPVLDRSAHVVIDDSMI